MRVIKSQTTAVWLFVFGGQLSELMTQIKISFSDDDYEALVQMARADYRPLREQIRYLVRQEAVRRGLIKEEATIAAANTEAVPQ